MSFNAQVRAVNLEQWKRDGIRSASALSNQQVARNLNNVLQQRLKRMTKQQFKTQGAYGKHGRWRSLSPKYAAWKQKRYPGKPILVRTGRMRAGFVNDPFSRVSNQPGGLYFTYGSDAVDYDIYHQQGGTKIKGQPPMRKIIDPTNQQLRGIALSIGRTIVEGPFSRIWFDIVGQKFTKVPMKYTGFEKADIP